MERSDSQRPSAADPAAPDPQSAKEPAPAAPAPDDPSLSLAEPPVHLTESESDAVERSYFDLLERETTQPVRRPLAYAEIPRAEDAGAYAPPTPAAVSEDAVSRVSEPQPFAVPAPLAEAEAPAAAAPAPAPQLDVAAQPASIDVPHPYEGRREPALERAAAQAPNLDRPIIAPPDELVAIAPRRDWRDLARRAANTAFLVFAGWFIAVLVLIAAYRFVNPPFSMLMAQRWITGTSVDKQWVPIERISPALSRAVIVAEDGRFCHHWGIDLVEAANAIRRASDGYPRGASTITMQVAKNLFLVPAKSYLRKLIEIPLTFAIELAWPKRRILEVYLNIVEWGPGVFGAEAASRAHFGRSAEALSTRQAAQLAAVLPNPIIRDAGDPGPRTAHKASIIQARAARTREASACVDIRR